MAELSAVEEEEEEQLQHPLEDAAVTTTLLPSASRASAADDLSSDDDTTNGTSHQQPHHKEKLYQGGDPSSQWASRTFALTALRWLALLGSAVGSFVLLSALLAPTQVELTGSAPPLSSSPSSPSSSYAPPADFWPTMVTTLRQCPSDPSTMVLSSASRWLTDVESAVSQFAYTVDDKGRRRDAWQQRDVASTSVLRPGIGYGAPEWDQTRSEAAPPTRSIATPTTTSPPIHPRAQSLTERLSALLWPSSAASAVPTPSPSASSPHFPSTGQPPLRVRTFDRHINEWVRKLRAAHPHSLTTPQEASSPPLPLSAPLHPFGLSHPTPNPNASSSPSLDIADELSYSPSSPSTTSTSIDDSTTLLDQSIAYIRDHEWTQAKEDKRGPYFEVTAPWYEAELPHSDTERRRLLFYGIETILPPKPPVSSAAAERLPAYPVTIGLSATVLRNDVPLTGLTWHMTSDMDYSRALFATASCSLHVDVDEEALRRRMEGGEVVDVERLRQQRLALSSTRLLSQPLAPVWVGYPDPHPQEHSMRLFCNIPPSVMSSTELLDQHPLGPLLRIRAVELHVDSSKYLAQSWVLPVCYVRTRRSVSALILGQPAYGPPSTLGADLLHQWIQYHLFLGVQQVYIADRFGSLLAPLRPYLEQGLLDYVRWPFLFPLEQAPYQDQPYVILYLQQFARLASDWVLQLDADEYYTPVHPYFTDNPRIMQPAADSCFNARAAWEEWERQQAQSSTMTFPPDSAHLLLPQVCRSILSEVVSLSAQYGVHNFKLPSVPMMGLPDAARAAIEGELVNRSSLDQYWSHIVDSHPTLGSTVAEWTSYSRQVLKDRLVWSDLAPSTSSCALNALDLFPARLHGTDGRLKMLYWARFVDNIWQHDVFLSEDYAAQLGPMRHFHPRYDQGWPNSGANHWRKPLVQQAAVNTSSARGSSQAASLRHTLCSAPQSVEDVDRLPETVRVGVRECCQRKAEEQEGCIADAIKRSGGQWEVATLTPHFPLLSEVFTSQYALEGWYLDLPLSLLNHISHLFCLSYPRRELPSCGLWRMFGTQIKTLNETRDPQTAVQMEAFEPQEDVALTLVRAAFRSWRLAQTWALHPDQRSYWRPAH